MIHKIYTQEKEFLYSPEINSMARKRSINTHSKAKLTVLCKMNIKRMYFYSYEYERTIEVYKHKKNVDICEAWGYLIY